MVQYLWILYKGFVFYHFLNPLYWNVTCKKLYIFNVCPCIYHQHDIFTICQSFFVPHYNDDYYWTLDVRSTVLENFKCTMLCRWLLVLCIYKISSIFHSWVWSFITNTMYAIQCWNDNKSDFEVLHWSFSSQFLTFSSNLLFLLVGGSNSDGGIRMIIVVFIVLCMLCGENTWFTTCYYNLFFIVFYFHTCAYHTEWDSY